MNSTRYQYDELARPLKIKRLGVIDSDGETEKFGLLDDLTFEYDGARLSGYGQNPDTYEGEEFFQRVSMPMATATRQYSKGRLSKENGIGDIFYAYNRRGQPKATVSVVAGFPYTETSLVKTHDCHGRLMAKTGTVKQGTQGSVAFDRRYVEGFTFNNGQLERVDFTGGYFDAQGGSHYLLTDRLGSVVLVVSGDCELEARYGYYPYGEMWRNASGQQRRLAAKERETIAVPGDYCFGPRTYRPGLTLWDTADRYNSRYPWLSPFTYCAANPVNFIDPTGNQICIRDGSTSRILYWKKINNAWGWFDDGENEYEGKDDFILAVKKDLARICGTVVGNEVISFLAYDSRELYILNYSRNTSATLPDIGYKLPQWIGWNVEGAKIPTIKGTVKKALVDFFHELGHAYNDWNPDLKINGEWYVLPSGRVIKLSERVATHFENRFRAEIGEPLRRQYIFDPGVGENSGLIIKKYKDGYRSLYFDENGIYYEDGTKNGYRY